MKFEIELPENGDVRWKTPIVKKEKEAGTEKISVVQKGGEK